MIIGGNPGGLSAASKAKREKPDLDVIVFEKGDWVSYGTCGLPYYVKDEIKSLDQLITLTPEDVRERGIDLRMHHEVTSIDPENEVVTVETDEGDTIEESYDILLVANGGEAMRPPIEGIDLEGVFCINRLNSAKETKEHIESSSGIDKVAVIGGGFIGIEMVEAFHDLGMEIHLFEMLPHILGILHEDASIELENYLREKGISIHLNTGVNRITGEDGEVKAIETEDESYQVDMVLLACGVVPDTKLAEEAGIKIGETRAIKTDEYGKTNYPNIYAVGDCAESCNILTNEPAYFANSLKANRDSRSIGSTIAGKPVPLKPVAFTSKIKVLEMEAATTGVTDNEKLKLSGFSPIDVTIESHSKAHYFHDRHPIKVSMTADKRNGKLLGVSIVGKEGVANRIGIPATALSADMTVDDIEGLELGYAPPFGPIWDPIHVAAKVLNSKIKSLKRPSMVKVRY